MNENLAGKLLVAMPGIGDPRFHRTVIMVCTHDAEHAMGVVLNKPKEDVSLHEVLGHLGLEAERDLSDAAVLDGGPVRQDRGFVLHSSDFNVEGATHEVTDAISLTATREVLEAVASKQAPAKFTLALGCAGWGAGQLEDELRHNAWMVIDSDETIVFGQDHQNKWPNAMHRFGFDAAAMMSEAGRA